MTGRSLCLAVKILTISSNIVSRRFKWSKAKSRTPVSFVIEILDRFPQASPTLAQVITAPCLPGRIFEIVPMNLRFVRYV